ncbi:MAG TPA: hypothetical protein VFA05_05655 [Gaiellaceae bacterium]|nr:hypothetical protein [Gaiellaceae bacterium]
MQLAACHGIGVSPAEIGLDLGWLRVPPHADVRVDVVEEVPRDPEAQLVWELEEPPGFGLPSITTQTWQEPDGSTWLGNTLNMSLRVDYDRRAVTVAPKGGNRQVLLEALASVALPLVAQRAGSLVLHGAAAADDGHAVLICAPGGSGKSSLLMGLVAAGWSAISEDQCVVTWDGGGSHRLWPGPTWVRLKQGVAPRTLVVGTAPRFEALDKVAWDLSPWIAHEPARLERLVILEPPGGDEIVWEPVAPQNVIPLLAGQVTWFQSESDFARAALPQVVRLAMEVPATRMRLPFREDWLPEGLALLGATERFA